MDSGSRDGRRASEDRDRQRGRRRHALGRLARADRHELECPSCKSAFSKGARYPLTDNPLLRPQLRLSLFPITTSTKSASPPAFHILAPKHAPSPSNSSTPYSGHSFHPDGTFLVSLERSRSTASGVSPASAAAAASSSQDVISVYATRSATTDWALVRSFSVPLPPAEAALVDLVGVKWSLCGRFIAAWTSVTDVSLSPFRSFYSVLVPAITKSALKSYSLPMRNSTAS